MSKLTCGIVGLPNVGKSTLFNALTRKAAAASNYPFCTIDPNVGIVDVYDSRLEVLAELTKSARIVPATLTFVDIAGLVKGASQGEGLGNQFLSNIRETDAILHVIRCFEDDDIIHVAGKVDPLADIEVIHIELILADLQMAENVAQKLEKQVKSNRDLEPRLQAIKKAIDHLGQGKLLSTLPLTEEENENLSAYSFLTRKKFLYAANISEADLPSMTNPYVEQVRAFAAKEGSEVIPICAKLEQEIAELDEKDALEFLRPLGLEQTGLNRLIKTAFHALDLITYITSGEIETRAWTIKRGTNAQLAAGKIHTDIMKGFIRAEVIAYDDMITYKGRAGAREVGKARAEGKEYIVKDGDVILFFHN